MPLRGGGFGGGTETRQPKTPTCMVHHEPMEFRPAEGMFRCTEPSCKQFERVGSEGTTVGMGTPNFIVSGDRVYLRQGDAIIDLTDVLPYSATVAKNMKNSVGILNNYVIEVALPCKTIAVLSPPGEQPILKPEDHPLT